MYEGQLLGQYADPENGGATGPHLHFEWWDDQIDGELLDPEKYLNLVVPDYILKDRPRFRPSHPVHRRSSQHKGYDLKSPKQLELQ